MIKKHTSSIIHSQPNLVVNAEKISQHTQQNISHCHVEKTLQTQVVGTSITPIHVTLISKETMECHVAEKNHTNVSTSDYLTDCETLPKTKLRERYKAEATAHRNMLSRAKSRGAVIHPCFRNFRDFLMCVGLIPAKGATLDRINNKDPEYAPGKVRWADKRTQNNNKGDTLVFNSTDTSETFTSSRLAKLQGVSPAAIRKRVARGWSDDENIDGKRRQGVGKKISFVEHTSSVTVGKVINTIKPYTKSEPTAQEILYQRNAEEFRWHREKYGEEALPAPLDALNKFLGGAGLITEEQYEHRFARDIWPNARPHVDFFNVHPFHEKLIEKIDPEYVARVREERKIADELKKKL